MDGDPGLCLDDRSFQGGVHDARLQQLDPWLKCKRAWPQCVNAAERLSNKQPWPLLYIVKGRTIEARTGGAEMTRASTSRGLARCRPPTILTSACCASMIETRPQASMTPTWRRRSRAHPHGS